MRHLILAGAVLAALAGVLPATATAAAEEKAPDFTLEDLHGSEVTLSDVLADGPVILDFWATWCKPCLEALPALQALSDEFADEGLTILAVSIDDPRSRSKIGSTMRSLGVDLQVLLDQDKTAASLYRVTSVPATYLIDRDGIVVYSHRGYRDGDDRLLAHEVKALIRGGREE